MIATADQNNTSLFLHFSKPKKQDIKPDAKNLDLNKIMQNMGREQFDYGTFKAAYDTDPRIKTMVHDFNYTGVQPKTTNLLDKPSSDKDVEGDKVADMAKNATDLGDNLT